MKVLFISLGCDKNLVDTETMLGYLSQKGYEITDDETEAEAVVVNTCCFIHDAKQESVDAILEMLSTLPPVIQYESEEIPFETLLSKQNTGFEITVEDDVYIVEAPWLIRIICHTDLDDYESLQYFQRVLISSGIYSF